jgi:hypothetical protein
MKVKVQVVTITDDGQEPIKDIADVSPSATCLSALWEARRSKGVHHTVFRTVFGAIPVDSPRLYHCPCQPHTTTSFSPLAMLLPERTTPDLLYLEPLITKIL